MNEDQHERLRGHRIRTTLKRVPGILADLEPTPKRGSGAGTSEPKLPISETVLEAGDVLPLRFRDMGADHDGRTPRPTTNRGHDPRTRRVPDLPLRMARQTPSRRRGQDEIADAVANLERLTDQPSATVFAGRCPECGGAIYGKEGRTAATCTTRDEHDEVCGASSTSMKDASSSSPGPPACSHPPLTLPRSCPSRRPRCASGGVEGTWA